MKQRAQNKIEELKLILLGNAIFLHFDDLTVV